MFGRGIRLQTLFPIPLAIIPLPNESFRSSVGRKTLSEMRDSDGLQSNSSLVAV